MNIPTKCGKCPMMGGTMCLHTRVPWYLALEANKREAPPGWCPLRRENTKGSK